MCVGFVLIGGARQHSSVWEEFHLMLLLRVHRMLKHNKSPEGNLVTLLVRH